MRTPSAIVRILLATWALAAPAMAGVIVEMRQLTVIDGLLADWN